MKEHHFWKHKSIDSTLRFYYLIHSSYLTQTSCKKDNVISNAYEKLWVEKKKPACIFADYNFNRQMLIFVMWLGLSKERYEKPHTFPFQSIVFFIRKQNNFVLRHPLGFGKPETYSRFYIYTCPICFIAPSCLGKTCDRDINRILKQFHFFLSVGLENVASVFPGSTPTYYSKAQHKWILQLLHKSCVQFDQPLIDINAINEPVL